MNDEGPQAQFPLDLVLLRSTALLVLTCRADKVLAPVGVEGDRVIRLFLKPVILDSWAQLS